MDILSFFVSKSLHFPEKNCRILNQCFQKMSCNFHNRLFIRKKGNDKMNGSLIEVPTQLFTEISHINVSMSICFLELSQKDSIF